jgi:hypothetical protein
MIRRDGGSNPGEAANLNSVRLRVGEVQIWEHKILLTDKNSDP